MQIIHRYYGNENTQHVFDVEAKDIVTEKGIRKDEIVGSRKITGKVGDPSYKEEYLFDEIPILRDFVICPLCLSKIQIKETINK